jgi:hypothetical protein
MPHIGLTLLPNTTNEVETSLDLQHQEAHTDDGIFTKLLETHCLYLSLCNQLNEEALSE